VAAGAHSPGCVGGGGRAGGGARLSYTDRERDETVFVVGEPIDASHTYRTELMLQFNRDFGPRVILSAEAGYFNSAGTEDYDGWWVGVRGRWLPDIGR